MPVGRLEACSTGLNNHLGKEVHVQLCSAVAYKYEVVLSEVPKEAN